MNVAEDERYARFVELHEARGSALIESKIEALALKQRKHIVEKRIVVRKLHFTAHWDHQKCRLKALVLLHQLRNLRRFLSGQFNGRAHRSQPDDCLRSVGNAMAALDDLHMSFKRRLLSECADRRQQDDEQPSQMDRASFQNKIPTDRFT